MYTFVKFSIGFGCFLLLMICQPKVQAQNYQFRYESNRYFPKPIGFVSDYEQVLSAQFIQQYEQKLHQLAKNSGVECALVTVSSMNNYANFIPYAIDLFNSWGIGNVKEENGICLLFSSQLGKVRITIGKGLTTKISDEFCSELINKKMMPFFKKEAYEKGLQIGLDALLTEIIR